LESKVKNPKKPKLDQAQKEQVRSWIEIDPNITMKKLKFMIMKNFNVEISLVGIWKNVQKMDFSHITARSVHHKQDKEKLEEFKKNSNRNKRQESQ
jgi:transposase